jgi:hypothetical protein
VAGQKAHPTSTPVVFEGSSGLVEDTYRTDAALFILFLGKDTFAGWPEGAQGAYGVTAWLALLLIMLFTELGHKEPQNQPIATNLRRSAQ